jgi:regulator of sigma E protease
MLSTPVIVLITVIILSVLIIAHELGHFFAAKRAGLWVEEFGIGIPPRLFGKKIGETIYSLNLFPFGGFVRLHGENSDLKITKPKRAFLNQSKKTRASIVVAGVFMNFLLAVLAFAAVYSFSGIPEDSENVRIVEIAEKSPAEESGFLLDDVVRVVEGQKVTSNDMFIAALEDKKDTEVTFLVEREGAEGLVEIQSIPRSDPPEDQGALGVKISTIESTFPPIAERLIKGVYYGFKEALIWTSIVASGLAQIIIELFKGQAPEGVSGPVGIIALTARAASFGAIPLINFAGILSVNLMILNILPFPALDGGRLVFIVIESFIGRKVLPKVENIIHAVGMAILLLLLLAITYKDIRQLIDAGGISGFIESVLRQ